MTKRVKYAKDDAGTVERTMFQRHDRGYCLRPDPCICDEGRAALERIRSRLQTAEEDGKLWRRVAERSVRYDLDPDPDRCPRCGMPFDIVPIYTTNKCPDPRHPDALTPEGTHKYPWHESAERRHEALHAAPEGTQDD